MRRFCPPVERTAMLEAETQRDENIASQIQDPQEIFSLISHIMVHQ